MDGDNHKISGEWPSFARNYISDVLNGKITGVIKGIQKFEQNDYFYPLFLQGTCGDINPAILVDPPLPLRNKNGEFETPLEHSYIFKKGSYDFVKEVGKQAGLDILLSVKCLFCKFYPKNPNSEKICPKFDDLISSSLPI
jgi:hypothetical protein